MSYKVKIDVFEGPFDLLVYLIEHAEMNIYDIQISEITHQYISYINILKTHNVEVAGEFMVLAATLIEIKSKMLLPRVKLEDADEYIDDPREELVQRILEYKKFKLAAENLESKEELETLVHTKPQEDLTVYTKEPDEYIDLSLDQFMKAFKLFLEKKNKIEEIKKNYAKVEREKMSVEMRITSISKKLSEKKFVTFIDLLENVYDRYDVVLTFISILELVRLDNINVKQDVNFGEISLALVE